MNSTAGADSRTVLVNEKTMQPLRLGQAVETGNGEIGILIGIHPPKRANSSGHVYVEGNGRKNYWYASVIGAKFVSKDDLKKETTD